MSAISVYLRQPGAYDGSGDERKAVMYKLYQNNDPSQDFIMSPSLKLEVNKAGSFEFDILPSHTYYSFLRRYVQYVSVKDEEENKYLFYGRILSITMDMSGSRHVTCEGLMANLLDCPVYNCGSEGSVEPLEIFKMEGTPAKLFRMAINAYRYSVREDINIGTIHTEAENYTLDEIDVGSGQSVGDFITSQLVSMQGGYLVMDYYEDELGDITGTLNWLPDPAMGSYDEQVSEQTVQFGTNLLDISAEATEDEIMTGIIPTWTDEDNQKHWINIGPDEGIIKPMIYGATGIDAIGVKMIELPAESQEEAVRLATAYIQKYCTYDLQNVVFDSYTVKALDLHEFGSPQLPKIKLLDRIRIKSTAHTIDQVLICTSITIDIDNPANNGYTLSEFKPKASSNEKALSRQLGKKTDKKKRV